MVSAQALKFGHMLTEQAGSTQWMEEHKGEASELLRKPLGQLKIGFLDSCKCEFPAF